MSPTMTILSLKQGDLIHVRAGFYGGNMLESNQNVRMSFSGFKLMKIRHVNTVKFEYIYQSFICVLCYYFDGLIV